MKSWLVHKGVLKSWLMIQSLYNWAGFHPWKNPGSTGYCSSEREPQDVQNFDFAAFYTWRWMDVSSCEHTKLLRDNTTKSNIHWCPTDMLKFESQIHREKSRFFSGIPSARLTYFRKLASHSTPSAWNYSQINGVETTLQLLKENV